MAETMTTPQPDRATILQDFRTFYGRFGELMQPTWFELRAIRPASGDVRHQHFRPTADGFEDAADWAITFNGHGYQIYGVRNALRGDIDPRKAASDADVVAAFFLWADCDDGSASDNVRRFDGPRPSIVARTGAVPDLRVHTYWELDEPTWNLPEWRGRQESIAACFDSDASVVNPARIMRIAGTVNWPKANKPDRVPEVVKLKRAAGAEPLPMERAARVWPAAAKAATPGAAAEGAFAFDVGAASLDRERERIRALSGEEWHNAVIRLVASYVSKGLGDAEIHTLTDPLTLAGYTVEQTRREVQVAIDGARRKGWTPESRPAPYAAADAFEGEPDAKPDENAFDLVPVTLADMKGIAPRRWLYGRKLLRGFVSVIASPGGTGKSALGAAMSCDMAAGVTTLHDTPHGKLRVWVYNLEDPRDETLRKLAAIAQRKRIDPLEDGNLFVTSGRDRRLIMAEEVERNVIVARPDVRAVIEEIKRKRIDVLIVDPFVRSHLLSENDNKAADFVMDLFAQIADEAECAVLLIHHTRKGFVSGEADSIRGASAVASAARVALTMQTMTPEDAKSMGVPEAERRRLVRIDDAKANLAPPSDGAEWIKLESQNIGNGTAEYPEGDNVQVCEPWTPPDAWDGLSDQRAREILDELDRGLTLESGAVVPYAPRQQDGDRWAGHVIVRAFGGDKSEAEAARILKTWIGEECAFLEVRTFRHPDLRKDRKGLFVIGKPGEAG